MNQTIIKQMREEEADLLRKLKAVRDFLSAYGEAPRSDEPVQDVRPKERPAGSAPRGKVGIDGFGPYGRRIVAESMKAMLTTTFPMRTRDIVQVLEAMDIEITGENKINAVGALLSRSRDIVSHGKQGWTLEDRDRALEIVGKYAVKENEAPHGEAAGASEADVSGGGTPVPSITNPFIRPAA